MSNLHRMVRSAIAWIKDGTWPITKGSKPDLYLRSRGINLSRFPPDLRMDKNQNMLAIISNPDGVGVSYQRTFFKTDGRHVRAMAKGINIPPGSAIRLGRERPVMGAAEGVETALSASLLSGRNGKERIPVWATVTSAGMATFEPPKGTERYYIYADNDENDSGLKAAQKSKSITWIEDIRIMMPTRVGSDWNDVLKELKQDALNMKRMSIVQTTNASSNKMVLGL